MIVDTSALMAIIGGEDQADRLRDALLDEPSALPAPALTEFRRVAARRGEPVEALAEALLETLIALGLEIVAYTQRHADFAHAANARFGKGMGGGGRLNMLDLMVYAVAKERDEPLLCTGRDFAATDLKLHPASRLS